ncbi:MAG: hypothetical protein BMS9Abin33_1159 [Gammaproteobacteria bacterium]|nr:MAG: hypothetical protein BMS9Abin33_1159 [Gammaproteobacteria bacterium]
MQLALLYNELNLNNPAQRNVYEMQTLAHLYRMRVVMETYYQEGGDWPDKKFVKEELAETVHMKRLPPNRFVLKSYEHTDDGFIAIIDDTRPGAADIRFSGDPLKTRMYFVQP